MALSYSRTPFAYLLLFGALYAGFGVQSPYLPRLLQEHGLRAETIGIVLASGTAIRLFAGPLAGSIADRLDAPTLVFAGCAAGAALTSVGYLAAGGFWPLFAITLLQASALAPKPSGEPRPEFQNAPPLGFGSSFAHYRITKNGCEPCTQRVCR